MPESIKLQIMNKVKANLGTLVTSELFRSVSREMDPLAKNKAMPSLMIYDGTEVPIGSDTRGITKEFPLTIRLNFTAPRDISEEKDRLVPKVQKVMEDLANIQLNGLATIVDSGTEVPFINEINVPEGGAWLIYRVEYRVVRGNPYATY
jgi:hypothetical protein